jgi:galactose oxidase
MVVRVRRVYLLSALFPILFACDREGPPGPPSGGGVAAASPESDDAPVRALYLCGNRFVLVNAQPFPVQVTWRIQGTEEQGDQALAAAPEGDPGFSELEVTTRHQGPLELYRGDQLLGVRDNERLACEPTMGPAFAVASGGTTGSWSAPFSWPIVAVHLHLLRTGKVLAWGKFGDPYIYDPSNGSFTAVPAGANVFCSGHAFLPDGRLFVAGGHISDNHGLPDGHLFNPGTLAWSRTADMRAGRWYPSSTELADGSILTIAGNDEEAIPAKVPEIWSSSGWRALTGATLNLPYYPRQFLAPNGKVFVAGELKTTRYLNTSGSGSWTTVGDRRYGVRDYGAAVMYLPGKILYVGGGRTTATAETIDLNQAAPAWKWTGSMAYPRRHLNATMLPTGEVLVTSGTRGTSFDEPSLAVHVAEIWNPATGAWRQVASNSVNRSYHSTALLMPDGRVLHAGSGNATMTNGQPAPDQKNAEYYSPPYLFQGARPSISSVPNPITYGTSFTVGTPSASSISKVSLIALGSVTHAFDMSQRFMWLTFSPTSSGLTVQAPTSRNAAPPGYYMLFILTSNGVPSRARIIRLR